MLPFWPPPICTKSQTRATKMVYGVEPDLTREGGSIPVTLTLQVILFWKWLWCWLLIADYENYDNSHRSDDKLRLFRRQLERMWSCCRWVPLMMELTLRTRRLTSGVVGGSISCSVKTSCWWRDFGLKVCLGGWGEHNDCISAKALKAVQKRSAFYSKGLLSSQSSKLPMRVEDDECLCLFWPT